MVNTQHLRISDRSGLSLTELLIVIGVIAIVATIAIPTIGRIRDAATRAASTQNAKNISQMSEALAALGVAHVIPESMGGVEATARLLREGVIVPEGPMAGERFKLSGMRDSEIEETARYLHIEYDKFQLRLIFHNPDAGSTMTLFSSDVMMCLSDRPSVNVLLSLLSAFSWGKPFGTQASRDNPF